MQAVTYREEERRELMDNDGRHPKATLFGSDNDNNNNDDDDDNNNEAGQCCDVFRLVKRRRTENNTDSISTSLLVEDLNRLSVKERNYVFQEIHGVADIPIETDEFVSDSISKMFKEISELPRNRRRAIDRAFFLRPSYKNARSFQLLFLRTERFQPLLAARRMAQYFESKLTIFGEEHLVSPITQEILDQFDATSSSSSVSSSVSSSRDEFRNDKKNDMRNHHQSDEEQQQQQEEWYKILPQKDQAGRSIFYFRVHHCRDDAVTFLRHLWYKLLTFLAMNESAQIHGFVGVAYVHPNDDVKSVFPVLSNSMPVITSSLPMRMCAFHQCFCTCSPNPQQSVDEKHNVKEGSMAWKALMTFLEHIFDKQLRIRFRTHTGSYIEIQYELMTFGLPSDCFSFDSLSSVSGHTKPLLSQWNNDTLTPPLKICDVDIQWKESHGEEERSESISSSSSNRPGSFVEYPRKTDILLGRGKSFHRFLGNIYFSELVASYREKFQRMAPSDQDKKKDMVTEIWDQVKGYGGRWLHSKENGWEIADESVERDKIRALLNRRSK